MIQAQVHVHSGRYVDLQGRHAALSTVHDQLTALMGRAKDVNEVLSVQRELSANLQQKEAMEAKMKAGKHESLFEAASDDEMMMRRC